MRPTALLFAIAAVIPACAGSVLAQAPGPPTVARSGAELAEGVERRLDDIARTLREIASQQRVLLMIRRIELAQDRLDPLEAEVRRAREEVRTRGEEIAQMRAVRDSYRQRVDELIRQGRDPAATAERGEIDRIDEMIELRESQFEESERRAMRAEDELARGRDRIETLDAILEEMLSGLEE